MSASLLEIEDDIVYTHNQVRQNPDILIQELMYILDGKVPYYPPSSHMAMLIESGDLNTVVKDAIEILKRQSSVHPITNSKELELAARDFADSRKPDQDLSMRVEKYTNWEGELNEIVHYSRSNVKGIDVIINIILSDYCGNTKNIETIFNPLYKYFGVRVFNHDVYDYCIVILYAENIYSTLKNTLYTSTHIDEELSFEKSVLSRNFYERDQYPYSEFYPRDHPQNKYNIHLNDAQKSRRKCRLNENDDGHRTLTVLRRESLERIPEYKNHDDPDYLYVNPDNNTKCRVYYDKPFKKEFWLGKGESTFRDSYPHFDRKSSIKRPKSGVRDYPYEEIVNRTRADIDCEVYYGDVNEVSAFEVDVTRNYGKDYHYPAHKNKEKNIGIEDVISSSQSTPSHLKYDIKDFVPSSHTLRSEQEERKIKVDKSFREEKVKQRVEEIVPRKSTYDVLKDYTRFSKLSAIPDRTSKGLGRLSLFEDEILYCFNKINKL